MIFRDFAITSFAVVEWSPIGKETISLVLATSSARLWSALIADTVAGYPQRAFSRSRIHPASQALQWYRTAELKFRAFSFQLTSLQSMY